MKKLIIPLFALAITFGMFGTASAVIFVDTVAFNNLYLSGTGTYSWQHDTPSALNVPYDVVNSATLEVFASDVDGSNDMISVGTLTAILENREWVETHHSGYYEGTELNIASLFNPWHGGDPLNVTLSYNEPTYTDHDGHVHYNDLRLRSSVFTIDYDNHNAPVGGATPEPASMMLLGMGILGLVGLKRKA